MSSHLIRQDLVPIVTGYLLLMAVLAGGLWSLSRRQRSGRPTGRYAGRHDHGWSALVWHVLADALGGYLLLAAIVLLYYYGVARVGSNFLDSAFSGTALLLAIALPVFLAASWLRQRRATRRAGPKTGPGSSPDQPGTNQPHV
jgi:Co/Zn/Cd efflux system component